MYLSGIFLIYFNYVMKPRNSLVPLMGIKRPMTSTESYVESVKLQSNQVASDRHSRVCLVIILAETPGLLPIRQYKLTTYNRKPSAGFAISGQTDSAIVHAVERHDPSATEEHNVLCSEGSITLNGGSQYQTAAESQDEGTARGENLAATTTDLAPGSSTTSDAQRYASPQGAFNLTAAAFMAHNCHLNVNMSLDETRGLSRPDEILQAAREMGFELPRECFEAESRSLSDWVEAQRRIRAHVR